MQVFVIITNVGIKINAGVNVKNWLINVVAIKDLFGILEIVNVNVINHLILENIYIKKNLKCRKKLVDKLVEEGTQSIDKNEMIHNDTLNDNKNICGSDTVYIVLFSVFLIISIVTSSLFIFIDTQKMKSLLLSTIAVKQ